MIRRKTSREEEQGRRMRPRSRDLAPLTLAFFALCLPTAMAKYGGGSGTVEAPFLISTPEDFQAIGDNPADWDKRFKLTQDIDLSGYDETSLRMIGRWAALGSFDNRPFQGNFDGNGKTIANFHYRNMADQYVGMFQHLTGDIKNLKLLRPKVIGNKSGTGALVGYVEKGGVTDCSATEVEVTGVYGVGGLVGCVDGGVFRSYSDGVVTGGQYVGGLIGQLGIGNVKYCFSKAEVQGNESVGGLIGALLLVDSHVQYSYARGDVHGGVYVGGLVGQVAQGAVWHCYSVGAVSGNQFLGGLVGYQRALAQVIGSLWDTQSSTQAKSVGGVGKTTAEMKLMDTYLAQNWDFFNTWTICEGINYPVLMWQIPRGDFLCPDGVNFRDFAWFAARWRNRNCGALNLDCDGADFDQSGSVEFRDLAIFAENWLAGL
jgi:hypothetical protein